MRPILYTPTETAFDTNGVGVLYDALSCEVTEERNGSFELKMTYPVSGAYFDSLQYRSIICAKPNPVDNIQPFRVYRITKPLKGKVTVYAEHISYDLSGTPASPFAASGAEDFFAKLKENGSVTNLFQFYTNVESSAAVVVDVPSSSRALLATALEAFGGEYRFDGYAVMLLSNRGYDNGVSIRYGKNLTSLEQDENCSNVYTGVYPYWSNNDGVLVTLPEKIVNAPGTYDFERIMPLDMSRSIEKPESADQNWKPTVDELRTAANAYVAENNIGVPSVSLEISFVQLEQTEEYNHLGQFERVGLCDTVNVEFPRMGISTTAKCVKTVYNALLDRYNSISLGEVKNDISSTLATQTAQVAKTSSEVGSLETNVVSTAQSVAQATANAAIRAQTQQDIYNKLVGADLETGEHPETGLMLEDGVLYFNAAFIREVE